MPTVESLPAPRHYAFVDGLRGITALYVVLNHIWTRFVATAEASALPPWFHLLKFGHAAVAIFIVLSGFCLMLPIARRPGLALDTGAFLKRRARRILPAYYAAMLLSLLLGLAFLPILPPHSREWQGIVLHALLLHNWTPRWSIAINGPFWSIALEWQIYFVFALLLLPVRRRFGWAATVLLACALVLLPLLLRLGGTSPWFLLLFLQGMLAAEWVASSPERLRRLLPVLTPLLLVATVIAQVTIWRDSFPWPASNVLARALQIGLDLQLGCAICLLLVQGAQISRPRPFSWLEHRGLVLLGSFSYSIYLLHDPLLALGLHQATALIVAAPMQAFPFVLCTILPATLGICWLFHVLFERPFLKRT